LAAHAEPFEYRLTPPQMLLDCAIERAGGQ
jgi:hypothetical protein